MAITFALVQSGTAYTNPANVTLTVTAGNKLTVHATERSGTAASNFTISDGTGATWTQRVARDVELASGTYRRTLVVWERTVTAEDDGEITVSVDNGTANSIRCVVAEWEAGATVTWTFEAAASNDNGQTTNDTSIATGTTASVGAGDLLLIGSLYDKHDPAGDAVSLSGWASANLTNVISVQAGSNQMGHYTGFLQDTSAGAKASTGTIDPAVNIGLMGSMLVFSASEGDPDPTITDVDTDETVLDGQTGVAVTGTDMDAAGGRTFTLRQGAVAVTQTETGTPTDTAAELSIGIEQTGADIKHGAATLRVTRTADSAFGELAVTVNPPTGQLYVDLTSVNTTADDRITATPDLEVGDQLHARGEGGGAAPAGLTLNADGTFEFSSGNTPQDFEVRAWDVNDATWGAFAVQSVGGGVTLTVADASHAHTAESPALTQANTLAVADSTHAHAADGLTLVQAHILAVADALHGHSAESPTLTEAATLAVAEALHGHTADSPALVQAHVLAVQDALHAHSVDNVVLSLAGVLEVADALHAHGVDNVALTQAGVLVVADALHSHAADNIELLQAYVLAVADALHGHTADALELTAGDLLQVADAIHVHTADEITLTQAHVLVVDSALHAHLADQISLQVPGFVNTPGRVFVVETPNRTFVVARGNRTFQA